MKAILITKYGGTEVLQVKEVPNPWPKENEILIKIHAAAINNTDIVFRKGKPFVSRFFTGLLKPKHYIPGDVLAGKVIEIGNNVTRFKIGDYVYGYSTDTFGAYAEYKCLPENSAITIIPENISFEEAAGIVDGGHTALVFLRDKGNINNKQKVLIYGASGSVGTAAIQIANSYGAEVIAVCSTSNIEMVKSLGAKRIIDYTTNEFTLENKKYDIIFDTVAKKSFSQCKNVLSDNGIYLTTFPTPAVLIKQLFQSKEKGKRALFVAAGMKPVAEKIKNLQYLSGLIKSDKLKTIISKKYSMDDIAEAHRYVETGHKKGNIVIKIC
ncbi:MAG TPA: NAD(P)-dependent alcohol dehydrogenase [Chitinophagaceae bacterium]|jgi:NADPH:quinone reductase-like Zn-dependent oxidoreductase|nr:NAD(P)-dependent alcohol dehydrogenase [Chitinophagaceae bacterium]